MRQAPRFMIAAAHKSSGKTVVSTGLAAAFRAAGEDLTTFKKGPDYIDPMWLAAASGRACHNLDFNAMGPDELTSCFATHAGGLSLVEANKGLYDGMSCDGSDSNAELAKLLGLPVVLVIDSVGMTRGIAPLLLGYSAFDPDVQIAGVILNRVGGIRHEGKLRKAVETYTDLAVLGSIWRNPALEIGERHLGLTTPAETGARDQMIARIGEMVSAGVDLDALRQLASAAPEMVEPAPAPVPAAAHSGLRIGILRDAAFGFYYPDDLAGFADAGATLVPVDAMRDRALPDVDGLFIGGGFPEMWLDELAANHRLLTDIRTRLQAGLPCYAECGGLMYLCDSVTMRGHTQPMVGLIPGRAVMHKTPRGRGYVRFTDTDQHPWGGTGPVRAHEFHYAGIEGLPPDTVFARQLSRGAGVDGQRDGIVVANTLAGFCHLRHTQANPWVDHFLGFVARCKAGAKSKTPA
ncbi:cobyrinate a,c-diamide synthase [Seohaeicola saemankumensis]|nr:cobyrinate a,c-diamide synthase [Seohaeicola saemankumensis]MCA0869247.1 cobyrinate a,c-diamide synthase [Seohaeicola saemankumensis]